MPTLALSFYLLRPAVNIRRPVTAREKLSRGLIGSAAITSQAYLITVRASLSRDPGGPA